MLPSPAALVAGTVALSSLFAPPLAHAAPLSRRMQDLASCLTDAGLSPVTDALPVYDQNVRAYNQRLQPYPSVILYPSYPSDIPTALSCASANNVKVSARGGGHSYASYGLGKEDGGLTIDMSNFRDISVDDNGLAIIGGGNRLGDIYLALDWRGWAIAAGSCHGVGIGGHAGFGGYGLASFMWGFLADQVIGYDVVLANGTVASNVTRESDSDLFWALNGAAPNFGLVTAYHVQAHHKPATAVLATYTYTSPSTVNAATAFASMASFGNTSAPANLGLHAVIGVDSLVITAMWYGPESELNGVIQSLEDELPPSYTKSVTAYDWLGAAKKLAGTDDLSSNAEMLQSRDSFYAKSLMTPSTIPISIDTIEAFFDYLWTSETTTKWFVEANVYGGKNSEINSVPLNASSFGFRDKHLNFQLYASSPTYGNPYPVDDGIPFVKGMWSTLVDRMISKGWSNDPSSPDGYAAYVNYIDPELTGEETKRLYWGSQYERLSQIKARIDPQQLLNSAQGIVPANTSTECK
ncbi:hypothetical protein JCM10449v2_005802 [Rhodotorula kratochvilovae]